MKTAGDRRRRDRLPGLLSPVLSLWALLRSDRRLVSTGVQAYPRVAKGDDWPPLHIEGRWRRTAMPPSFLCGGDCRHADRTSACEQAPFDPG